MKTILRKTNDIAVIIAVCLLCTGTLALCTGTLALAQDSGPADNLLVNPDWEDGLTGWDILADSHQEFYEDHDAMSSIVYQDVPVTDFMAGNGLKLSGRIGLAPEDPTQEAMILAMELCGSDGYVLDDVKDDGSFLYNEYVKETQQDLVYHEILMAVPEEASFVRVSLEIIKEGKENRKLR